MLIQCIDGSSCLTNPIPKVENPAVSFPGFNYKDEETAFGLSADTLAKHVLLLGGSGCGKTNTFYYLLKNLREGMTKEDIALIFDTKGEFYEKFRAPGDLVIGNSSEFYDESCTWNIFDEILVDGWDERTVKMNAREISAELFHDRGSATQPFFCNAARDLFYSMLMHFYRQALAKPEKWMKLLNNKSLLDAFSKFKETQYLSMFKYYPDLNYMQTYIGNGENNQALGVFGELNSMLAEYFVGILAEHKPDNSISMRKAVREKGGKAVFIEYDLSMGETLSPMYTLLIDQALKEVLGRSRDREHGEKRGNVYLVADEFKLLPKLRHIDDALNFGRSQGVRVTAGIQSIDQLYDVYGEAKGKVIASGFGSLFAFHTNDASSREYITKRFGANMVAYTYQNSATGVSEKNKERQGNTVEDWEQLNLGVGQAVIGLNSEAPFLFDFADFEKEEQ